MDKNWNALLAAPLFVHRFWSAASHLPTNWTRGTLQFCTPSSSKIQGMFHIPWIFEGRFSWGHADTCCVCLNCGVQWAPPWFINILAWHILCKDCNSRLELGCSGDRLCIQTKEVWGYALVRGFKWPKIWLIGTALRFSDYCEPREIFIS